MDGPPFFLRFRFLFDFSTENLSTSIDYVSEKRFFFFLSFFFVRDAAKLFGDAFLFKNK